MSIEKQCVQSPPSSCFESRFIGAECYVSGSSVQSIVEPQMYSNSVNLYSDTEHGESLLLTFHAFSRSLYQISGGRWKKLFHGHRYESVLLEGGW